MFSFHPATITFHGVKVKAPWERQDASPHPDFLKLHYSTSISKAMKANGDDYELDDEELSELKGVANEKVRIWLASSFPSGGVMSSWAENKGNIDVG